MAYVRKTVDEYRILSNYGYGYEETTTESTYKEGKERLKEYRTNEPNYSHKLICKRVKIVS